MQTLYHESANHKAQTRIAKSPQHFKISFASCLLPSGWNLCQLPDLASDCNMPQRNSTSLHTTYLPSHNTFFVWEANAWYINSCGSCQSWDILMMPSCVLFTNGLAAHPRPQPRTPSVTGGRSAKMDGSMAYNDIWTSPSSISLPSRKRDILATDPDPTNAQNKSRRTTPTPSGSRTSAPSRLGRDYNDIEPFDIIDLTGCAFFTLRNLHCMLTGTVTMSNSIPIWSPNRFDSNSAKNRRIETDKWHCSFPVHIPRYRHHPPT